jgi:hypothetical protein
MFSMKMQRVARCAGCTTLWRTGEEAPRCPGWSAALAAHSRRQDGEEATVYSHTWTAPLHPSLTACDIENRGS